MPIKRIAVIGAGQMGAGIAHICAQANYEVLLQDKNEGALTKGITTIEQSLTRAVQKERITEIEKERTLANITTTASLSEITEVDLAIEAVIEQLDVKQNIFASLDEQLHDKAILATNTSALSITEICVCNNSSGKSNRHAFYESCSC